MLLIVFMLGSDDDKGYLQADAIESELNIRVIRHHMKKPDGLLETISLWPSIKEEEVMMVGDRYLTDIYGGNVYGLLTVCVSIITERNDNWGAILVFSHIWIDCREDELNDSFLSYVLVRILDPCTIQLHKNTLNYRYNRVLLQTIQISLQ